MTRRKTKVAQERDRKKLRSIIIVLGIIVLVIAGSAWFLIKKAELASLDENLCPPEPTEFVAVVVDVTDPLTLAQRQDLRNQLELLRNSVGLHGKIAFFRVDASTDELLKPIITRCNPGSASDFSEVDRDLKQVQDDYDNKFVAPIVNTYEQIFEDSGSDQSPILGSIQSVNLTELQVPIAMGKPRQIILISDLLQNTDNLSFYGELPSPEAVIANPDFQSARTNLRGVRVQLWMLQRGDYEKTQPTALPQLWNVLLQEQGATSVSAERISG